MPNNWEGRREKIHEEVGWMRKRKKEKEEEEKETVYMVSLI